MQELRILKWCDVCHKEDGAYVEIDRAYVISFKTDGQRDSATTRKLEVCDRHGKSVDAVLQMLTDCGTMPGVEPAERPAELPIEPITKQPGVEVKRGKGNIMSRPVPCPICKREITRGAMPTHIVYAHAARPIKQPAKCPDCGEKYAGLNSMATHRRRTHGWDMIAELAAQVKGKKT